MTSDSQAAPIVRIAESTLIRCANCGYMNQLDEVFLQQLLAPQRDRWQAEAREQERAKREELEEELNENKQRIKRYQDEQTTLRRERRQLQAEKEGLELDKEQMRDAIRKQERAAADARANERMEDDRLRRDAERDEQMRRQAEEYDVKLRQKDAQLKRVNDEVEVLRRKADSGIPTEEGIARQDLYGKELCERFPDDMITVTDRGKTGWDVTQVVRHGNLACGTIPQECKRVQKWNPEWVRTHSARVRNDPNSKFGILVSQTLPPGTEGTSQIGNIWVTDFAHAIDVITILRKTVIMIHWLEMTGAAKADSAGRFYDYFSDPDGFGARYRALEEATDRLRAETGKLDRYSHQHVARVNRIIDEIREQFLEGISLDLIHLGVKIPPWLQAGTDEGDDPQELPGCVNPIWPHLLL